MIGLVQPQSRNYDATGNINLVASGTVGAWSAWNELFASSTEGAEIVLRTSWFGSLASYNLLQIGVGGVGSEVVLVDGILHHYQVAASRGPQQSMSWNVRVPGGSRVSIRRRCSRASENGYLAVSRIQNSRPIGVGVEAYGATGTSPFGTAVLSGVANSFGSLVEVGTTGARVRQISVSVAGTGSSGWLAWEVHVGPIGGEVALIRAYESGTIKGDGFVTPLFFGPFDVDIPEGTRVTVRQSCQVAAQTLHFVVQGTY